MIYTYILMVDWVESVVIVVRVEKQEQ